MTENITQDNRLRDITYIKGKDNIFKVWQSTDCSNLKLPNFTNPLYKLYGFRYDKDNIDYLKEDLDNLKKEYKDDPWQYVSETARIYETFDFPEDIYEQSIKLMKVDEIKWFEQVAAIPYVGIQCIFMRDVLSLQSLIKFMKYMSDCNIPNVNLSILAIVIIREFMDKLKTIDDTVRRSGFSMISHYKFDVNEWEKEADAYITEFVNDFRKIPQKDYENVFYSMLSYFRFFDGQRRRYDGKLRDEIIAQTADNCNEDDLNNILNHSNWRFGKPSIFHKSFLYAEYSCAKNQAAVSCQEKLWEEIKELFDEPDVYMHYNQPDDQQFSWLCAKLLSDDTNPTEKAKTLIKKYLKRGDGWKTQSEKAYSNRRSLYFFLTVASMAAEWLLKEGKQEAAKELILFVYSKWQEPIYYNSYDDEYEYNFLQQFWARCALFLDAKILSTTDLALEEDFDYIESAEYRLSAVKTFFKNIKQKDIKKQIMDKPFLDKLKRIFKNDIYLLQCENEKNDLKNKKLIKQIEDFIYYMEE